MTRAADIYRKVIPLSVRTPLWLARHALWDRFANPDASAWRHSAAELRVHLRWPIAQVEVDGIRLYVDLRDRGVGLPLFVQRSYEPQETAFIRQFLKKGMVFVDVGANLGYYSTLAARCVGPSGQVLAIEPESYNFRLLKRNVTANNLTNVVTVNVALGEHEGTARLFTSQKNFGDHRLHGGTETGHAFAGSVHVTSLDILRTQLGLKRIDLIKIDVQGYEVKVQAGMKTTLMTLNRTAVLTEFWPHGIISAGSSPEEFFACFERYGFSAYTLSPCGSGVRITCRDALAMLPPFDPNHPDLSYINILFQGEGS